MIFFRKCKIRILYIIMIFVVSFFLSLFPLSYYKYLYNRVWINKIDNNSSVFDSSLLTHQMILYDLEHGITSTEIANKALSNINYYLAEVGNDCKFGEKQTTSDITDYISCANKKLGKYFYYQPSQETSNNYAKQRSDCDLNTYLLIDVASLVGIDAYIIYSPRHAFWAAKSRNKDIIFWETTIDNNNGGKIDIKIKDSSNINTNELNVDFLSSFYTQNSRVPYYRYYDAAYGLSLYKILVSDLSQFDSSMLIESSYFANAENVIIEDAYIELLLRKNKINDSILRKIENSLQTDITDSSKHISLATFYKNEGMSHKAYEHVDTLLKLNRCDKDCIKLVIELNLENNSYFLQKYVNFHHGFLVNKVKHILELEHVDYTYKDYQRIPVVFFISVILITFISVLFYLIIRIIIKIFSIPKNN